MSVTVDDRHRVALPNAKPGEEFDVQTAGDGVFILRRLEPATNRPVKAKLVKENGFTVIETDCAIDEKALNEALAEFP
jgi:hypothetical protein